MPEIDIGNSFEEGLIAVPREHVMKEPFCMCDLAHYRLFLDGQQHEVNLLTI